MAPSLRFAFSWVDLTASLVLCCSFLLAPLLHISLLGRRGLFSREEMATEVHEAANGKLKKGEQVEPLGELKGKEDMKQAAADLCHAGDANGCDSLAEKEEPISKLPPIKQKGVVLDGVEEEGANESQGGNDYSSEEEEGDREGEEDAREGDSEPYEEDNDEEYVDDGEDDEGDDDESQPPPKRRK
ncbi:hypothetical protein L7F22_064994 [Adiantum nelumboides]|nr:hypothetical protein [Adiantum nelumboides]